MIDYNDMVWLSHVMGLAPKAADWVFVDEAQDLNKAQLELVLKARPKSALTFAHGNED